MSRTIHESKGAGYDWWTRRPLSGLSWSHRRGVMKFWKRRVNKIERQQAKHDTAGR